MAWGRAHPDTPSWVTLAILIAMLVGTVLWLRCGYAKAMPGPAVECLHMGARHHANQPVYTDGDPFDPATKWPEWRAEG